MLTGLLVSSVHLISFKCLLEGSRCGEPQSFYWHCWRNVKAFRTAGLRKSWKRALANFAKINFGLSSTESFCSEVAALSNAWFTDAIVLLIAASDLVNSAQPVHRKRIHESESEIISSSWSSFLWMASVLRASARLCTTVACHKSPANLFSRSDHCSASLPERSNLIVSNWYWINYSDQKSLFTTGVFITRSHKRSPPLNYRLVWSAGRPRRREPL